MNPRNVLFAVVVSAVGSVLSASPQDAAQPGGRWDEVPLPDTADEVTSIGIEPEGVLWAMLGEVPHYFDGRVFRRAAGWQIPPGRTQPTLVGGTDRPLYAVQLSDDANEGRLFRLSDGRAILETDYYHGTRHRPAPVHVSRDGRLFHWGQRFLAVRVADEWQRREALLDHCETFVFETSGKVFFYYNSNLYSVDNSGRFEHREVDCPLVADLGRKRIHGCLWGENRMLLVEDGTRQVFAFNLETGDAVDVGALVGRLEKTTAHDLFRARDGAAWLAFNDWERRRFLFLRVTPKFFIARVEATGPLHWRNLRHWHDPKSVLNATDGSIWFGTQRRGVARVKGEDVRRFDWRQGLDGDFRFLAEGVNDTVYAATNSKVFAFDPEAEARPLPAWTRQWDELRLASVHPLRDAAGNMWILREDRPNAVSRYDGHDFEHREVPFETRRASRLIADDRGHLLLCMQSYPDGCYDVGQEEAVHFSDVRDMLAAAVHRGATRLFPDRSFQGAVILEGERIWFGYQGHRSVHAFDGRRWDELQLREPIYHLHESVAHGVLLQTQSGRFYRYDRGQLVEHCLPDTRPAHWLWGPQARQPFEPELLGRRPGELAAVEHAEDGQWYLLVPTGREGCPDPALRRGPRLDPSWKTISRGLDGGHFSRFPREPLVRIFGDAVHLCDLRSSPLSGRESRIEMTLEDRARNVWFDGGGDLNTGARHVFLKRVHDFEVRTNDVPAHVKGSLTLGVQAFLAGERQPEVTFFWRRNGSTWHRSDAPDTVTVPFPEEGTYRVEVVAMDRAGAVTPGPRVLQVVARVPQPDTILTQDGPWFSDDAMWPIPARAVPSEEGRQPRLAFRFPDRAWQVADPGRVSFFDVGPGEYKIEVAAFEGELGAEDSVQDPTPLHLVVTYDPDHRAMVDRRVALLEDGTHEEVLAAIHELQRLGPAIVPHLRRHLDQARKAARKAEILEGLLQLLEQ